MCAVLSAYWSRSRTHALDRLSRLGAEHPLSCCTACSKLVCASIVNRQIAEVMLFYVHHYEHNRDCRALLSRTHQRNLPKAVPPC